MDNLDFADAIIIQKSRETQLQQFTRDLNEYFTLMDIKDHEYYSLSEIINKIRKSGIPFSAEMMRKIFLSVNMTHPDKCNGKQLKESYIKRRWELQTMLDTCNKEFEALEQLRHQAEHNLRRYETEENKYCYQESKLTIQIVSFEPIYMINMETQYKINLECQEQVIDTQWKSIEDENTVFWNELFSFEIGQTNDLESCDLIIRLFNFYNDCIAKTNIVIEDLADQRRHEIKKDMYSINGDEVVGSLLVSCQWLYSRYILYKSYVREFKQKRDQKLNDMSIYQQELKSLDEPFLPKDNSENLSFYIDAIPEYIADKIDVILTQFKINHPTILYKYIVFISFCLQWIASATRSCFLDSLITSYIFWCDLGTDNYNSTRWNKTNFQYILFSILASLILDVVWMIMYFPAWNVSSEESDLRNFSKIFTFFNFMWKIVIFLIIWKSRHDFIKYLEYEESLLRKKRRNILLSN
ncbi:hypothetical protein ACR3K2_30770 [Cryptosporidium serpentis]